MKIAVDVAGTQAEPMVRRQLRTSDTIDCVRFDGGSLAVSGTRIERNEGGGWLVCAGSPTCSPDPRGVIDSETAALHFAKQEGAFASLFWSADERRLVVVTDFVGFKPLYMLRAPGVLQFASDTKAWKGEPDAAAWGAFVSFGHTIGDRTLLQGVHRVPPGTVLIYDKATDTITNRIYWNWPAPNERPDTRAIVEALMNSVNDYGKVYGDRATLLLSGGFDSRLIACLLKRNALLRSAFSVSHSDELFDADARFAKAFARKQGLELEVRHSPSNFFSSDAYLDYLFDSDGATPSLYLFISQVSQFVDRLPVWEGLIPGCTLAPLHQTGGGFSDYLEQECNAPNSPAWQHAEALFRDDFYDAMRSGFTADLAGEQTKYRDDEYGVAEFVIRNRSRNRAAINPLKVIERNARAFIPGLTRNFFEEAGSISYVPRRNNEMYMELLRRYFPEALCCPIVSGGKLIKTSSWSASYFGNSVAAAALRFSAKYPRVFRHLGLDVALAAQASDFIDPARHREESDPYLDVARIEELARKNRLSPGASKLLFHWRAWRRLHGDRPFVM